MLFSTVVPLASFLGPDSAAQSLVSAGACGAQQSGPADLMLSLSSRPLTAAVPIHVVPWELNWPCLVLEHMLLCGLPIAFSMLSTYLLSLLIACIFRLSSLYRPIMTRAVDSRRGTLLTSWVSL